MQAGPLGCFIWVQMEFFLNGRCKSLPLSGIVWSVAVGREEQDARVAVGISPPRLWLAGATKRRLPSPDCSPGIYSWFLLSFPSRQLSLRCFSSSYFLRLISLSFLFSPLCSSRRDIAPRARNVIRKCTPSYCIYIPHHHLTIPLKNSLII